MYDSTMNGLKSGDVTLPIAIASGLVGIIVGALLQQTQQFRISLPRILQLSGPGTIDTTKPYDNYIDNNCKILHDEIETHLLETQKPAVVS